MASNQPAYAPSPAAPEADPPGEWDEWDSSAESADSYAASLPGTRHRLPRQRTVARGSTVLGVAAMAAVGAGGVAAAADAAPAPIAVPDLPELPDFLAPPGSSDLPAVFPAPLPAAVPVLPSVSAVPLVPSVPSSPEVAAELPAAVVPAGQDRTHEDRTHADAVPASVPAPCPGEALRARIVDEATRQRDAAAHAEREAAEKAAAAQAAREAAEQKVRAQAAAAKAAAEAQAKADAEAAAKAEAERLAQLAVSYLKPLASYTPGASFGEVSSLWANTHTGQDFGAPTGTPVHAIHTGTVTSAGWAGSYGYRVVVALDDGTELWYCHLSTMVVTSGPVTTGDTIGRVGATGNVTSPHLHLEVRPSGAAPIDPAAWLRTHDITI